MKVRAILKSLLFAYALTGVALLLLALVLFAFDLGETAVDAGIIIIYVLASFIVPEAFATGSFATPVYKISRNVPVPGP